MSQDFGQSIEVSTIPREKTSEKLCWQSRRVCISVIARVHNNRSLSQSFLYASPQGLALVSCSKVSVIGRCLQGGSQL